ncbi:MAG: endonuclease/exonuclease/phosphatase family protein [Fluviicola sp.]|jgi:endonuclease/exonuclease/phosphatase family metal-dependent hydrolase|nr:endonuclease/exonuclease/phosphatase family protein [Fluviicola sp.]
MGKILKKILSFSSLFKVLTIICLCCLLLAYLCPFVHPSTFWVLPFFGLAYPVILVCTLLLLLIWILARSKWALITLFILIIGGKLHFRMLAVGSEPEVLPTKEQSFHIMSYNVRLFDLYDWTTREKYENRDSIFHYIERENPDVICFQEFYHQDKPTEFPTRDYLIKALDIKDYHERYSHKLKGRQNFGIAMLSKYPMIAKGAVVIENDDDDNYCIYADIVKNTDTLRIYNVHLRSIKFNSDEYAVFGDELHDPNIEKSAVRIMVDKLRIAFPKRADQAVTIIKHMETSPYPVVICGDFNDTPMSYTYNQFCKSLTDAYKNCATGIGSTYAGRVPAGRIDYIFYSPSLHSANFKIQKEIYSDHKAISCFIYK